MDTTHKFGGIAVLPVNPQTVVGARRELERRYQDRVISAEQYFESKGVLDALAGEAG